jgi:creatinine amidohydrolase
MAGKIYNLEKLSYPQIEALDREKTVFIIAISPLEVHGPHLPVGVDALNASFFTEHAAKYIISNHPEYDVALFPLLPVGTQVYKHIGSFYIKPATVYDLIYNTGRSLAVYGFINIFVLTAHGTSRQIVAIEKACHRVTKKHKVRMICLSGAIIAEFLHGKMYEAIARKLGRYYTEEEKQLLKYDYHAGWWETSMMLKIHPELVDNSYKDLKPYLKNMATNEVFSEQEHWQGYAGAPAMASTAFAEASIEVFSEMSAIIIDRFLQGEDVTEDVRSPFFKYPWFYPFFKRNLTIGVVIIVFLIMIYLLFEAYIL